MLTKKVVERLLRAGEPGNFYDGRGLRLEVRGPRSASWVSRYQIDGVERWMGLGSAHTFDLKEARQRNRKLVRQLVADGIDPLARKREEKASRIAAKAKARTFGDAAQAYIETHQAAWHSQTHGAQFRNTLRDYVEPIIGAMNVAEVGTPDVLRVLEQRVAARANLPGGPFYQVRAVTADRVRTRIEMILDFATARGWRTGDNPAALKIIRDALPARSAIKRIVHHAALPYAELPGFMAELRTREGIAAKALQFVIMSACRAGEAIGATWDEIDVDRAVWTIPAARMKSRREHTVPLSKPVIALLRELPREAGNPFVFVGMRRAGLSDTALGHALKRGMKRSDVTIHGFRSTFSDWSHERTSHASHTIEISLAHSVGNATEQAYRRGGMFEKRAQLMADWAKYCTSKPVGSAGNVTPIAAGREVARGVS